MHGKGDDMAQKIRQKWGRCKMEGPFVTDLDYRFLHSGKWLWGGGRQQTSGLVCAMGSRSGSGIGGWVGVLLVYIRNSLEPQVSFPHLPSQASTPPPPPHRRFILCWGSTGRLWSLDIRASLEARNHTKMLLPSLQSFHLPQAGKVGLLPGKTSPPQRKDLQIWHLGKLTWQLRKKPTRRLVLDMYVELPRIDSQGSPELWEKCTHTHTPTDQKNKEKKNN